MRTVENLCFPSISAEKRRFFALFKRKKRISRNFFELRAEPCPVPSSQNFFLLLWVFEENSRRGPRIVSAKTQILRTLGCKTAVWLKIHFSKAFSTDRIAPHFPFDISRNERRDRLPYHTALLASFGKIRTFTRGFQKAVEGCVFLLI